ncbi:MAG: hypothetical protein GX107_07745 [Clostridiales bacterium]|nr:hypothetical protein [Clostridiales bacterium]
MSYCVNCGVELDKSAVKCVLCSAPVINPFEPPDSAVMPYSDRLVIPPKVRRRYAAFIISMVLLIPNIVCLVTNILFPSTGAWAIYLAASTALVWILFVFPFLIKKPHRLFITTVDAAATLAYVYFFYAFLHEKGWFAFLAVPLIIMLYFNVFFLLFWTAKKKRRQPYIITAILAEISLYSLFADALFNRYYSGRFSVGVSVIIVLCCAALMAFFIVVAKNYRLRAWLTGKFFV